MVACEKKISEILHDEATPLGKLLQKVFIFNELEATFNAWLEPNYRDQVRLGSYQNGKLIVFVKSSAYATHLQFRVPDLLTKLRANPKWASLRNIQVKVSPFLYAAPEDKTTPTGILEIPDEAKARLRSIAEALDDGPDNKLLKEALINLAQ